MATDVGIRVRKLRERRGLSQLVLAQRIGRSDHYLIDLESGKVDPRLGDLLALARELGTEVDSFLSHSELNRDSTASTLEAKESETERRKFLELLVAAVGVGAVDPERLAAPVVDVAYLRDAETVTAALLSQWYCAQPALLLPPAMAHLGALQRVLPGPSGLENLTGRTALLVGYLFAKLGRIGEARTHYALADSLSRDTGDSNLLAVTLIAHSDLHCWRRAGDARRSSELVHEAAALVGGVLPLVRVAVMARCAEERAVAGDAAGCLRDMEVAEASLRPSPEHWYGPRDAAELAAVRGTCELLLGRHSDAAATLGWTLDRMHPSATNWRAVVTADRDAALAHI